MFAGRNVTLEGVVQIEGVDYTLVNGLMTFAVTPPLSSIVKVNTGLNIIQRKVVSGNGGSDFGSSIDTTTTGDTFVVGAPKENGAGTQRGAVYIYTADAPVDFKTADSELLTTDNSATTTDSGRTGWTLQKTLTASVTGEFSFYGTDVAITNDGLKVLQVARV